MVLTTLSDYIGFSILWALPLIQTFKLIHFLRSPMHTASGRSFPKPYDSKLEEELRKELHVFHEKSNSSTPKIIEIWNPNYIDSIDTLSSKHNPTILILPHMHTIDKRAFLWLYKHEIAHLINHHTLKLYILKILTTASGAFLLNFYYGFSFAISILSMTLLTPLLHLLSLCVMDIQADNFTFKNASIEELQGGLRFLKAAYSNAVKKPFFEGYLSSFLYLIRLKKIKKHLLRYAPLNTTYPDLESQIETLLQKNTQEETLFIESQKEKILRWIDADNDD